MIKKSETSLFINNSKLKKKGLVFATQRDGPHKHVTKCENISLNISDH